MARRPALAIIALVLVLCHLMQGVVAAAMPCADTDDLTCPAMQSLHCVDPSATGMTTSPDAPCMFCLDGGCQLTHAPSMVWQHGALPTFAPAPPQAAPCGVIPLESRLDTILRPPK